VNYFIKRDLNEYGPYTLADLQKYVASGNILLTDLCRSEGLTEWVPVSQVIGNIPVPAAPQPPAGAPAAAYAAPAASPYPPPPNLHWGICVLLTVITCTLFGWIWAFVQAVWVKRVQPSSKGIIFYSVAAGLHLLSIFIGFYYGITLGLRGADAAASLSAPEFRMLAGLMRLVILTVIIVGNFNMRDSIEEHFNTAEPIGLSLSGVMTFFFGILYFQYHFTKVNEMKRRQVGYSV
jgi:GYF domain 2